MESLYVDTTQIGNKWDCSGSSTQSEGRHLCRIVAIRSEQWMLGMECFSYLRNIQDLLSDGKTSYERRFGEPFNGPIIPFGWLVQYYPISAKDQSRIYQFGKKALPGLFLGYALYAEGIWKGDIMVADIEELETMDASEIYSKRLNAKEVIFHQRKWKIHSSSRRWKTKIYWRRSGTENIHLDTGAPNSRRRSKRFSWRIRRVSTSTTSRLISRCRWSKKRFLVHVRKLHIPPSRWNQSQTSLAERRIIPYSTEIHWRLQNYSYKPGCYARKPHRWLLEYRWIKRFVWFLDRFHSVYSVRWESSRWMYVVRGETEWRATSRPDNLWPELWTKFGRNAKLREKHKWAIEKTMLDNARRLRGIYFIDPEDKEFKETNRNARRKLETPMAPAMPCKTCKKSKHGETRSKTNDFKSKFACILEASESTRMRMEESLPKYHEEHIAGKVENSEQHNNLVHKFIPMPQAMRIPAAKAAVDK